MAEGKASFSRGTASQLIRMLLFTLQQKAAKFYQCKRQVRVAQERAADAEETAGVRGKSGMKGQTV